MDCLETMLKILKSHQKINQDMTVMCRQLKPTSEGVQEIYAFSKEKMGRL